MKNVAVSLMAIFFAACSPFAIRVPILFNKRKRILVQKDYCREFGWTMKRRAR